MKTLTKIKLINWHGFYNETININGGVLITGENGTGKSTLLDAIYFVLTGGEENFNSAANTYNSRTVETYMRGKTGIEGNAFLRCDKYLISHIALEYFDTNRKEYFVLGVVLEILEGKSSVNKSFYHIPNAKLLEEYYLLGGEYRNFQDMKRNNNNIIINELKTGGKRGIRKNICQILEMENSNDRYYQLLPKALSFKPIGENGKDVNDFVYEFLMPENNTDLENIKATINSYNEIKKQLEQETLKKNALRTITTLGSAYESLCDEKYCLNTIKDLLDLQKQNDELLKCEKEEIKNSEALKALRKKTKSYEYQRDHLNNQLNEINNCEEYRSFISLRKELDDLEKEITALREKKNYFNKIILAEVNDVESCINSGLNLTKYVKNEDYPSFRADLETYRKHIEQANDQVIRESVSNDNRRDYLVGLQIDLDRKRTQLSKGLFQYNLEITRLINLIKDEGKRKFNKEILVTPLCEMLEIKKEFEKHRNAIEGYLANRRFDLFVQEQYFDFALQIYVNCKKQNDIHSVGLVDSSKITDTTPNSNSLATMLETKDTKVKKYVNYLLGNVIFTDKHDSVNDVEATVDESVFVYSSYSFKQKNPKIFSEPFIGIESIKMQLEAVKKQLKDIDNDLGKLIETETKNNILKSKIAKSECLFLLGAGNVWEDFNLVQNNYNLKKKECDDVGSNQQLAKELSGIYKQKNEMIDALKQCDKERETLTRQSANIENKRAAARNRVDELQKKLEEYCSDSLKKEKVDKYSSENSMSLSELDKKLLENERETNDKRYLLASKMGQYIKDFNFDAVANPDSLPSFYNEINTIVLRNLVTFEGRLEEVQNQATLIFQNSYIEEIRENIKREKENIDLLNKVLKERPFGSDEEVYQFVIFKSKDDKFGQYYDVFSSNQNFTTTDLFTDTLSDKNASLMQELFERLTSDCKDSNQEKLVREYTDYRKFMSYDIRITNKYNKESFFSKNYKEKSGGETQTPFYVVIASSFDQIVKGGYRTRSPGCLVMFDEAFNNMDESRIESMMQYFNQLSIQPIIAVPTARAKSIFPYVGTSVVLVKSNDRIVNIGWNNDRISEEYR